MTVPSAGTKPGLHPRNKNNTRYDLPALILAYPELEPFRFRTKHGDDSIDFSDPAAVRSLNTVLLKAHYGVRSWELPAEFLCPPIPGRADHLHHLADLLASDRNDVLPLGPTTRIMEIGTGASCIYPLLGRAEYGWSFVASETDSTALNAAIRNRDANGIPPEEIAIRHQEDPQRFFAGIIGPDERFHTTMCNPPFHTSIEQAMAGTRRKWKNLGLPASRRTTLNFGGQGHELVYPGGETAFISGMIGESIRFAHQVGWFTTLVSKASNLPTIRATFEQHPIRDIRELEMSQGQKRSRLLAWTFLTADERRALVTA